MPYEGINGGPWPLRAELLSQDLWYKCLGFVTARNELAQLSFKCQRTYIRRKLNTMSQIHQPFRIDKRFPPNEIYINASFEIGSLIRCILSALDVPESCSGQEYDKAKEAYLVCLKKLFAITVFRDGINPVKPSDRGVFDQESFEDSYKVRWV